MADVPMLRKVAVISGGSSGIGYACAEQLLAMGYRVVLLARDQGKLLESQSTLADKHAGQVDTVSLDVTDAEACSTAIAAIIAREGRIDWLITSAGIVEPAMFEDLALAAHRAQMETNYFGTLHLVMPVARVMREQRQGMITLISSAAAYIGIIGYSGYAPGKFAVRALGEILRLELQPHGIIVNVAVPPDTDTPQLRRENETRPPVTKKISEGGGILSAQAVAKAVVSQAQAGRFTLAPSLLVRLLATFHSLYAPLFLTQQRRILRAFGRASDNMNEFKPD